MPTMKLYLNGASAHTAGGAGDHIRAPRGDVQGWTKQTAARQKRWLWCVDSTALDGDGYAVTLTVRDLPASAEEWARLRRAWIRRMERRGAIRIHWVTEWQARGVPHLHAAVYFEPGSPVLFGGSAIAVDWLLVSEELGSELQSQDVKRIDGGLGWLKYLAKHASRGASHYQRQGTPEGWDKSGRMWGHTGSWPVVEPLELKDLSPHEFYRVRRLMRAWAIAEARKAEDWPRVSWLRRAPSHHTDVKQSRFQGVSEWIPESVSLRLVDYLEREN
jgi:hypothetical protein